MPVKKELPPVGTKLYHQYKGVLHEAEIVNDINFIHNKAIRYKNRHYGTMSTAAKEITKKPVSGWVFWKIKNHKR